MNMQQVFNRVAATGIVLAALCGVSGSSAAEGALNGLWQTGEDNSIVEVTETNGVATGKLVSSDNPKAVAGTEILRNFSESGGTWKGSIYAVRRDKLMDATITPSADSLAIDVNAGFISKDLTWTRAPAPQSDK